MPKLTVSLIGFIIILNLFACQNKKIENADWINSFPSYENRITLTYSSEKKFLMDSSTSLNYGIIQYDDSTKNVVGFNAFDKSFLLYDYASACLKKRIHFPKETYDELGDLTSYTYSFDFNSFDSIYLFRQTHPRLFWLDSSGKIRKSVDLMPKENTFSPPSANFGEPFFVVNNQAFISAYPGRNIYMANAGVPDNLVLKVDMGRDKMNLGVRYPDLYQNAVWGEYMHHFFTAYNPYNKSWVYSFPIDHNLYQVDSTGFRSKVYGGSEHLTSVTPLSFEKRLERKLKKNEEVDNYRTQHVYDKILYDSYRHLYYRIVTNATPAEDLVKVDRGDKTYKFPPFYIIILNEKMEKVGEQEFDTNKYSTVSLFISEEGICIPRSDVSSDAQLVFDVFKTKHVERQQNIAKINP
ncbi:MAG: hypothetical protein JWP69_574 [Flaviaesturariibacter sp.]|nr:hypothetical protein [Flaviaesturariibacter sp.]